MASLCKTSINLRTILFGCLSLIVLSAGCGNSQSKQSDRETGEKKELVPPKDDEKENKLPEDLISKVQNTSWYYKDLTQNAETLRCRYFFHRDGKDYIAFDAVPLQATEAENLKALESHDHLENSKDHLHGHPINYSIDQGNLIGRFTVKNVENPGYLPNIVYKIKYNETNGVQFTIELPNGSKQALTRFPRP